LGFNFESYLKMKTVLKSVAKTAWEKCEELFSHIDHVRSCLNAQIPSPGSTDLKSFSQIPKGFKVGAAHAGLKSWPRKDIAIFKSEVPAVAAATFTTNLCPGAPVQVSREVMKSYADKMQVVVVNSACANSATGPEGVEAARKMSHHAAAGCNILTPAFVMSTGIIGQPLPIDKVTRGISEACSNLGDDEEAFYNAAHGLMLEDKKAKIRSVKFDLPSGGTATILVIAKGAGMVHPHMATVLTVGMTDVNISQQCLQEAWLWCIQRTINHIDVDGDMRHFSNKLFERDSYV
jgi:glutamate N-acetyltransferase / amino-acid N-acetyltransferase